MRIQIGIPTLYKHFQCLNQTNSFKDIFRGFLRRMILHMDLFWKQSFSHKVIAQEIVFHA